MAYKIPSDNVVLLSCTMHAYKDFCENTYILYIIKLRDELKKLILEIEAIPEHKRTDNLIKSAVSEYNYCSSDKAKAFQIEFLKNRSSFDLDSATDLKFKEIANDYAPYWNRVLSSLKMAHAIVNRRKYLIENCDKMAEECRNYGHNEVAEIFDNYKAEQIKILNL